MEKKKTVKEQISDLEAERQAKSAALDNLVQVSIDEGRSMDETEQDTFDEIEADIKSIDNDLKRLRALEKIRVEKAVPVEGKNSDEAGQSRSGVARIKITQKDEPGVAFARYARCIGAAKGNLIVAERMAEKQYPDDKRILNIIKAAVSAGSTLTGSYETWGEALVGDEGSVFADFIEFLRPQTILGKFGTGGIPSLRRVPFRIPLIGQTSGGDGYWVGEGHAKPLTKLDFARTTLEPLKVANIAVITEELLRYSNPAADILVRDALAAALKERMDNDFTDPTVTAVANVSPASITSAVVAINSSGNDADAVRADIRALFSEFIDANNAPTSGVFIMPATMALSLSLMMNGLGQPEFPNVNMNGGTLHGLPVIASQYVPTVTAGSYVILVNASDIYIADDGGIAIDVSREASLEMDDDPSNNSKTPTESTLVSLWQTNSVGIRAERTINWALRRTSAVAMLDQVNWGEEESS